MIFHGVPCQVLARYYRTKSKEIIYDLRELSGTQVTRIYHRKVGHMELRYDRGS